MYTSNLSLNNIILLQRSLCDRIPITYTYMQCTLQIQGVLENPLFCIFKILFYRKLSSLQPFEHQWHCLICTSLFLNEINEIEKKELGITVGRLWFIFLLCTVHCLINVKTRVFGFLLFLQRHPVKTNNCMYIQYILMHTHTHVQVHQKNHTRVHKHTQTHDNGAYPVMSPWTFLLLHALFW